MGIFSHLTKQLFGRINADETKLDVIDGVIVGAAGQAFEIGQNHLDFQGNSIKTLKINCDACDEPDFVEPLPPDDFTEPEISPEKKEPVSGTFAVPGEYLIHLKSAGRAKRTIEEYVWDLQWWQKLNTICSLGLHDMERILAKLHPSTARRKIAALRSFAKWQLREGDGRLHTVVSQVFPPKTPGRVPKDRGTDAFIDFSKCALDLAKAGDRRGIWLGLMNCCGLRISEVQTAIPAPGRAIKVIGKGNKERLVPAPGWLLDALQESKDKNGKQWRKGRAFIWLEMKKMGITNPHSLRHTFASELVRKGFTLEQVKMLLGHAKLDTTLVYARVALPEDVTKRLGVEVEH